MLYKIINPSDPYTIEIPSLEVGAMVAVLLGQGKYGFTPIGLGESIPMFAFGGGDDWAKEHFNETLMELSNRVMDTQLEAVAAALDSVLYGDARDRDDFIVTTEGMSKETKAITRTLWQDDRHSSLDNIGARAYRMAAKLREAAQEGMDTVQ